MLGLGKLVKYEMKSIGRIMLPLYGAFLLVSVLLGVSLLLSTNADATVSADGTESYGGGLGISVLETVSIILYVLVAGAVLVVTTVLLIQRFYRNLLGNEGYLSFTLPVSTGAHVANKTISAGIWMALGLLAGSVSAIIIVSFFVTPAEIFREIGSVVLEMSGYGGFAKAVLIVIEIIVLVLLMFGEVAIKIYGAISLGQRWAKHRVMGAFAAYIVFGIGEGIIGNIACMAIPPYYFTLSDASGFIKVQQVFLGIFISLVFFGGIYWFITHRMLDRHLDLQ